MVGLKDRSERRKYHRASLTWAVYLKCASHERPLLTRTRDISSGGFYCLLNRPVRPGERVECDIIVPTHGSLDAQDGVCLRCRAHAVRVEEIEDGAEFGMACRIEEYRLVLQRPAGVVSANRHEPCETAGVSQNIGMD